MRNNKIKDDKSSYSSFDIIEEKLDEAISSIKLLIFFRNN